MTHETPEVRAAAERAVEYAYEAGWVRRKLGLPENAILGDVQGQLHILCSNAHGYVTYIKAYKCDDKQGEIARLTVELESIRAELTSLRNATRWVSVGEQNGVSLIAAERERQCFAEGWTAEHDDKHCHSELALAAVCYATPRRLRNRFSMFSTVWPWDSEYWKPTPDDRIKELVKAGALIAAEIDRLQRQPLPPPPGASE